MTASLLVVAALIERVGRFLIARRPPGSWMEGYWEFPGGKVEPGEDPRRALERELREELGLEVEAGDPFEVLFHAYPERTVLLLFFRTSSPSTDPEPRLGQELHWATPEEMAELPFLPADAPAIEKLRVHDSKAANAQKTS